MGRWAGRSTRASEAHKCRACCCTVHPCPFPPHTCTHLQIPLMELLCRPEDAEGFRLHGTAGNGRQAPLCHLHTGSQPVKLLHLSLLRRPVHAEKGQAVVCTPPVHQGGRARVAGCASWRQPPSAVDPARSPTRHPRHPSRDPHLLLLVRVPVDAGAVLRANVAALPVLLLACGSGAAGERRASQHNSEPTAGLLRQVLDCQLPGERCTTNTRPRPNFVHHSSSLPPPSRRFHPPEGSPTCLGSIFARNASHSWSNDTSAGRYVSCTASVCPVRPLHTCRGRVPWQGMVWV